MMTVASRECRGNSDGRRAAGGRFTAGMWVAVAVLGGCASPPATTQVDAHFQRIGVVSVVASQFTERSVGATEFDDKRSVRDIAAWQVDRAYEQQLAAAVQSTLGATAVPAASPPAELLKLNDPATPFVQPEFWDYRADPVAAGVRAYCARNGLDGLLVASASVDDDVLGGSYRPLAGAGLYAHADRRLLHLSAALTLIECATGRPLERHRVASGRSFAASHGYPVRDLSTPIAGTSADPRQASDEMSLKQALIALPAEAWTDTLRGMLRTDGPPVFGRTLLPGT